jgi:hypothetical protein
MIYNSGFETATVLFHEAGDDAELAADEPKPWYSWIHSATKRSRPEQPAFDLTFETKQGTAALTRAMNAGAAYDNDMA